MWDVGVFVGMRIFIEFFLVSFRVGLVVKWVMRIFVFRFFGFLNCG